MGLRPRWILSRERFHVWLFEDVLLRNRIELLDHPLPELNHLYYEIAATLNNAAKGLQTTNFKKSTALELERICLGIESDCAFYSEKFAVPLTLLYLGYFVCMVTDIPIHITQVTHPVLEFRRRRSMLLEFDPHAYILYIAKFVGMHQDVFSEGARATKSMHVKVALKYSRRQSHTDESK